MVKVAFNEAFASYRNLETSFSQNGGGQAPTQNNAPQNNALKPKSAFVRPPPTNNPNEIPQF
jgi:hypothetical protein